MERGREKKCVYERERERERERVYDFSIDIIHSLCYWDPLHVASLKEFTKPVSKSLTHVIA